MRSSVSLAVIAHVSSGANIEIRHALLPFSVSRRAGRTVNTGRNGDYPTDIVRVLDRFTGVDLTKTLGRLEDGARGVTAENCGAFIERARASRKALAAAAELKRLAGQINVTIHALEFSCVCHTFWS